MILAYLVILAEMSSSPTHHVGYAHVAAVGWTLEDQRELNGVDSAEGFEGLFAAPVARAAEQGAELVVSPEMGFMFYVTEQWDQWLQRFSAVARNNQVNLAVGYYDSKLEENRMFIMGPDGRVLGIYTKTHLTPFEDYNKGWGEPVIADAMDVSIGGMICQDDNFTDISRRYGRQSVSVLAVPTLDWALIKDAHLQNAIHRSIETGCVLVRGARDGISAIVSGTGDVVARRDHFVDGPGEIVAEVPLLKLRTFHSRFGPWLVLMCGFYLIARCGWILKQRAMASKNTIAPIDDDE